MTDTTRANPCRACAGLTLVELLIALAIVSTVGLVAATSLFAHHRALESDRDLRASTVQSQLVGMRIDQAIRSARLVLARSDHVLVLWKHDHRDEDDPYLSQLHRIEWDEASGEIRSYQAPEDLSESDDESYDLHSTNFDAQTASLASQGTLVESVWTEHAEQWLLSDDGSYAFDLRLLTYRLTINAGETADARARTVAVRHWREAP